MDTDTDTTGHYRFEGVGAGWCRVTAEKPGFVRLAYGARHPFAQPAPLEVRAGEATTADLALPRGAALEGRVVDEAGEPAENVDVSAVRLGYGPTGRRRVVIHHTTTDDLGRFRLHSLPPGEYLVEAAASRPAIVRSLEVPGERPWGFARTYYPNTPRLHEAHTLSLDTGEERSGLEVTLTSVPLVSVTVRLVDRAGVPPASWWVRLAPVDGAGDRVWGLRDPRAPGVVTFPRVSPGEYWVTGTVLAAAGGDPEFAAQRVTVTGDAPVELALRAEPGARVEGRVEADPEAAAPSLARLGLRVVAYATEFELPTPGGGATAIAEAPVDDGGRFAFASLFGPRLVRVTNLPAGWGLQAAQLDEGDIADQSFDFRAANAPRRLRLVITNRTAYVGGTVIDDRERPVAGARVVLFGADPRLWTGRSRFVLATVTAADGHFAFEGVLPSEYLACATAGLEDDAWTDPAVLGTLRRTAAGVTVGAGERRTLTLRAR